MWRKIGVGIIALIGTCTILWTGHNMKMEALITPSYYEPQDTFERTNASSFQMGGLQWNLIYTDASNGEGYIMSENLVSKYNCTADSTYVSSANIQTCLQTASANFSSSSSNDDTADMILTMNHQPVLDIMTLEIYDMITQNDTDTKVIDSITNVNGGDSWLNSYSETKRLFFWRNAKSNVVLAPYTNIAMENKTTTSTLNAIAKINLPKKGILSDLTVSNKEINNVYGTAQNAKDAVVSKITTVNGAGPLHFYLYDTDAQGTSGSFTTPANSFELKVDAATGSADILIKDTQLSPGDYYLKVRVVDESTDNALYHTPSDFRKDSYRTKESEVIHVKVEKGVPTIEFTDTSQKDMKIGDPIYQGSITYTNTDTITLSDITYSISGGVSGILEVKGNSDLQTYDVAVADAHTGSGLPASFQVSVTIKETANYKSATTVIKKPIFVYKDLNSLTWSPVKGNFSTTDVTTGANVGSLLANDGVGPFTYEFTTSSDSGYKAEDAANNSSFSILSGIGVASGTSVDMKTSTSLVEGEYKLQVKVTDAKHMVVYTSITIKVTAKAQAVLDFKDKAGGTVITNKGKSIYFDDTNEVLFAEGGSTGSTILYDYAPQNMQPNGVSDASEYATILSSGKITPKKVGTIKVQAEKPGDASYSAIQAYMDLTILPAKQSIAFTDATSVKRVKKGSANFLEDAKGTIDSNHANGVGGITYSSSDPSVAAIDPATGEITVGSIGTATITAILNDSDASNSNYDANYETKKITKTITVYDGMSGLWKASTPHLQADKTAIADASTGTIEVVNNNGNVTYAVSKDSTPENADASLFKIVGSGASVSIQLKQAISGANIAKHGGNTYKVQIIAADLDGPVTIDCVITIEDADNDFYFTDANGNKITNISKVYDSNNNQFTLWTHTSNGKSVSYALEASANTGIVSVNNNAVSILKVGTTTIEATVPAGSGFKAGTVTIPVTITPATQSIAFDHPNTTYVAFTAGASTSEPATLTGNAAGSITFTSKTPSICSVVSPGTVTAITQGTCTIEASNSDANYNKVSTTKDIIFHVGATGAFTQSAVPQADNDARNGKKIGDVSVQGGVSGTSYTYSISTANDPKNANASFFKVDSNYGSVSLKQDLHASDIALATYDKLKKSYILKVQVDAFDATTNTTTTMDCEVDIKGASLHSIAFDDGEGNATTKISRVYAPNDTFSVALLNNTGNALPVYSLQSGSPIDVIDPTISGNTLDVLNANDVSISNPPVIIEAFVPAKGGYEETTVTCEIEITKASQDKFSFVNPTITMMPNSSVTPAFKGTMTSGPITMTSRDTSIVDISGADIKSKGLEKSTTVTAVNKGNRNYKDGVATVTIEVSNTPAYPLVISVPSATYGDSGKQAAITSSGHTGGAILTQTWTSSDPSIAEIDNAGNITIHKAGQVTITCEQTSDKDPTVKATITFTVDPKPITVTIDDKNKRVGETVPTFSATVDSTQFVGKDTIGQPNFICVDTSGNAVTDTTGPDNYPITGTYDKTAYPNYAITVIDGNLTVTQDTSQDDWYYLEGVTSGNKLDPSEWHKEDVKVVLDTSKAGGYDEISIDQSLWDSSYIIVNTEDENLEDVYFKEVSTSALATSQQTTIKIDKTKPEIVSIDGEPIEQNAVSKLLHHLTFGAFFKPKQVITIKAEDAIPAGNTKVSGITSIDYEVYELDKATGLPSSQTPYDTGTEAINANGEASFSITDIGLYRVCATTTDAAGNQANTKCADLNVKRIHEDVDKDGEPDFKDANEDGCPDLNIILGEDSNGKKVKLNVAEPDKNYPYMNIDSDGDGKPDLNIDSDDDGKPDLNLVDLSKETAEDALAVWNPTICVIESELKEYTQPVEYCTGTNAKPQINIVKDNGKEDIKKQIPSLNIDTDGDFIADLNISKDGETAYLNIATIESWKPVKDYTIDDFTYDTMKTHKPYLNIDSDHDGYPDINIDINKDGVADLNIDVDGDGIPDLDIDSDGDRIRDLNVDIDNDGVADEMIYKLKGWKPEKTVDGDVSYDTMIIDKVHHLNKDEVSVEYNDSENYFLPNYALKVQDVSNTLKEKIQKEVLQGEGKKQVAFVYDISLVCDDTEITPNGTLKIRIPIVNGLKNPSLLIETIDGQFKAVIPTIENGCYVYESETLGIVSVLGDVEDNDTSTPPDNELANKLPDEQSGGALNESSKTSVKGTYSNSAQTGTTGTNTGDRKHIGGYVFFTMVSFCILLVMKRKQKQ